MDDDEEEIEEEEEDILEESIIEEFNEKNLIEVPSEERKSAPYLSLFELISIICTRVEQIQKGGEIYASAPSNIPMSLHHIAYKEVLTKNCPLSVRRIFYDHVEIWEVNELIITGRCISEIENVLPCDSIEFTAEKFVKEDL